MGEHAQKRIVRKLDLERFLSKLTPQPAPQASLEQYTISESVAATMLYIAAYANSDVVCKSVVDLGCGTGRLAIGASYLGAQEVVGVDVDKRAIKAAVENSRKAGLTDSVQWIAGDIESIAGRFDTVLQNPPFGVQTRLADRAFLVKALQLGNSIYSLHNHPETDKQLIKQLKVSGGFLQVPPSPFLERFVAKHDGAVKVVYAMLMTIPKIFDFHTKAKHDFVVDLYKIERLSS
ncbi:MAG: METTL5 family protein [Candidatus Bathyarchaeia archaeon]|jgi:putative methylase